MLRACALSVLLLGFGEAVSAECIDLVEVGEPGFMVIEKCGEPQRREREERRRSSTIEVVTGSGTTQQRPQQPLLLERWYYDSSLNAASVIYLEDGGVTKKERLLRPEQ